MTAAGGSLEDCHTNTFVFADLNGLKWKCLKRNSNGAPGQQSLEDDPVLRAYGECLGKGLLCTWRRRPRTAPDATFDHPAPRIESPKELWVFWYSAEEPDLVTQLQDGSLIVDMEYEGCEVGVNYETRVLFFKALHHVIERIHLRYGYVRFGKYFVRPLEMPSVDAERTLPEYVNALNYEFSLLGESLVIIIVCVQRQPTVLRLAPCHVAAGIRQPVILGPWTMRAVLLPDQPMCESGLVKPAAPTGNNSSGRTPSLAEIQAVITHEWKKWKKIQALPVDEDDDEDEEEDILESNVIMPKMVLVEIDGVQMFYPSCFIGVLASEMDFAGLKRRTACMSGSGQSTSSQADAVSCTEDHEVEEIFSTKLSAKNQPRRTLAPLALSHCRRSFDGVRAARRSFEDGCLSVLLSRRADSTVDPGGAASFMGAPTAATGMGADVDGTMNWNFFDYLRREYCYCNMCKNSTNNSNVVNMETDNAEPSQLPLESNYAFHRSPTGQVEAVTPDHSPTFVDELKALRLATVPHQDRDSCGASIASSSSSSASSTVATTAAAEARSAWVANVFGRPGLIGGRLEIDRSGGAGCSATTDDADILNVLVNNRNFPADDRSTVGGLPPPRTISPFTPIGAISPDSQADATDSEMDPYSFNTKKMDPALQQRLKDFDYTFNPLKNDNFTMRSYHLVDKEARKSRPTGPPQSNVYLKKSSDQAPTSAKPHAATSARVGAGAGFGFGKSDVSISDRDAKSSGAKAKVRNAEEEPSTSILKSLLDDGTPPARPSYSPPRTAPPVDPGRIANTQLIRRDNYERPPIASPMCRRQRHKCRRRRSAVSPAESSLSLPIGPDERDPIYIDNADLMTSAVVVEDHADLLTADDELKVVNHNESIAKTMVEETLRKLNGDSVIMDQMVETPPAFLNQPDGGYTDAGTPMDTSASVATNDGVGGGGTVTDHGEDMDHDGSDHGLMRRQRHSSDGKDYHEATANSQYHFPSSVPGHIVGSSDQLLSPPASNERVEFSGASGVSMSTAGSQPNSLYGPLSATGAVMHDSLSIIYPTPPTPMQQFSPQNVAVVNAAVAAASSGGQLHHASAISPSDGAAAHSQLHPHSHIHHHHPPLKHTLTEPALLSNQTTDVGEGVDALKENMLGFNDMDNPFELSHLARLPKKRKKADKYWNRLRLKMLYVKGAPDYHGKTAGCMMTTRNGAATMSVIRTHNEMMLNMDRSLAAILESAEQKLNIWPNNSNNMCGSYGGQPLPSMPPGMPMGMGGGPRNPNLPNFMAQQQMNSGNFSPEINAALMARGGGVMPPHFRNEMLHMQQQQQQFLQQQMMNNQMQAGGMMPNLMNGPLYGRTPQQQQQIMAARQQQQMNGTAGGGNFPFSNQQQAQAAMMNRFGSPQMPGSNSGTPLNRSNSTITMEENGYAQFSSPKQQQQFAAQTPQRATSNSSAQHMPHGASNGGATPMDHPQLSSVSSTASSMAGFGGSSAAAATIKMSGIARLSTSPASDERMLSKPNLEAIVRTFQRGNSFVIAALLRDTVLDLHFDSVFDGCPICCCNVNIRTFELGLYIRASADVERCDEISTKRHQNSNFMRNFWSGFQTSDSGNSKCNCGFSAIRHRYLCGGFAGLFPNDSIEACGVRPPPRRLPSADNTMKPGMGRLLWFNANQQSDREFIDLLRQMSLARDFCSTIRSSFYIGAGLGDKLTKSQKVSLDATHPSDYIVSRVDSIEMDQVMDAVVDAAINEDDRNRIQRPSKLQKQPIHHNWGVQVANEIREPKDSEYIATIREVQPLLEEAMRRSRNGVSSQMIKKLEGPLTWRSFILKTSKVHTQQQEDEICQVEPIPNVIVATEREPIMTNPQLVSMWDKLSLAPYDQTKDVLYLAVVPDTNIIVEKCRIFMEELSSVYSDCRFGYHGRVNLKDAPRDGIVRLNCSSMTANNPSNITANAGLLPAFEEQFLSDRKLAMSRLKGYTDNFESEMLRFFTAHEAVFSRRAFYESFHRNKHQQAPTSLANSDSDRMPPPPVPIQSPNSVLSSASGPSSANAAAMLQIGQSISPNAQLQRQQQQSQISPAAGPNSAPSASNLGGSSLEELTPDGVQQQQFFQQRQEQDQAVNEANLEKEVEESLSAENPMQLTHLIVIYLINPFSFGTDAHHPVFARVATAALLRAYNSFLRQLNVNFRPQVQLELINLQSLYDYAAFCTDPLHEDRQNIDLVESSNREKMSARDCLRKIAFTVFSQPRTVLPEHMRGVMTKSMTRFGMASSFGDILDEFKTRPPRFFKVQSCPFILSPTKSIGVFTSKDGTIINPTSNAAANSKLQLVSNEERILFVSYCLIGDEWLCAAVTDEQGHLLDNVLINLVAQVPSNGNNNGIAWQYANQSQIFDSIQRLWLCIQSILVTETRNWRLVIGRIGKLGHGEFKAWTETLSKKNLRAYNSSLKKPNGCKSCSQISGYQEMPAIFSACLISTEPELHLRVFPSSAQSEGNPNTNLFTASISSTSGNAGNSGSSGTSLLKNTKSKSAPQGLSMSAVTAYDPSVTHIMVFPTILNISFEPQTQSNEDDFDFENLFNNDGKMEDDEQLGELMNMDFADTKNDEVTSIDNQPMATGYYISTAPALDMPEWFWSSCPSARRRSPVHLKNSLHIHTGNIQQSDEIASLAGKGCAVDAHHPLDSTATDEVLKYVLEKYNALSWMNVDFATGARLSCLPVHVQALLRLYKSVTTLFS